MTEEETTSEFGRGFAYCLGLYLCHADKRFEDKEHGTPPMCWANGAGDHLLEFEAEKGPEVLRGRCIKFASRVVSARMDHRITWGDIDEMIREAKDILREYDAIMGMREIKFRTRNSVSQKWVYWDLRLSPAGWADKWLAEVDFETVGQFTGLKDKEGKEIYEEDIVEYYDSFNMWLKAVVRFMHGAFGLKVLKVFEEEHDYNDLALDEFWGSDSGDGLTQAIRIIGNIYENPELVKK